MIELLLNHKSLTRRDLYGWIFRSLLTAPIIGGLPGVLWGLFVLGPVEGSSTVSLVLGALIGGIIGVIASQALGWATVRAPFGEFACLLSFAVGVALIAVSMGSTLRLFSDWIMFVLVMFWILGLNLLGRRHRPQKGLKNTEATPTYHEGPIERFEE